MPDEPTKLPPKTEALAKGVETETKDRVRRIDTLTEQINKLQGTTGAATRKISKDVSTVSEGLEETRAAVGELKGAPSKDVDVTVPAMNNVLKRLGDTMSTFAIGIKRVTADTARATKDTISQYGKAVSEDISINRQNVIAMSLARATPLFGYFAAKFMETDVFRNAAAKIKSKIGDAFSSVAAKIGGIFKRKKEVEGEVEGIPKAQKGAYVEKAGLVKVHPAEVIAPIDKILKQIGEKFGQPKEERRLLKPILGMTRAIYRMEKAQKVEREGLIKSFLKGFVEAEVIPDVTWQEKLLETTIDLKTGLLGMDRRITMAWQRMLVTHPVFRTLVSVTRGFAKAITFPFKMMFRVRGKYISEVRKATRADNVFMQISNLLGLLYGEMMIRLDQLIDYSKQQLEFQTGKKAIGLKRPEWRIARKALRAAAAPVEWGVKKALPKRPAELLTKERGVGGHLKALLGIKEKKALEKSPTTIMIELLTDISGHIQFFRDLVPKRGIKQLEIMKDQAIEMKKSRKGIYQVGSKIGGLTTRIKKMGGGILRWMVMGISMLMGSLRKLLSPSLKVLFKLIRRIPGVKAAAKGIGAAAKVVPKLAGPAAKIVSGALAKGGIAAAGVWGAGALAAGAIGYGIGTLINKAIDWGFGEKGGLGKWFHDWVSSDAPKKMWEGFLSIITWPFRRVKEVYIGAKESIAKGMDKTILTVINMVLWPFDRLKELLTAAITWPLKRIEDLTGVASETVVSMITWPFRKLRDLASGVTGWILEGLGIKAKAAEAKEIATKIPAVAETVDAVSSLFTTPVTKIKGLFITIKDQIVRFVTTGISKIGELPGKIWDDISQIPTIVTKFISSGVTKVKELPGKIWDDISQIPTIVTKFISSGVTKVKELPGKIWDDISPIPTIITNFISSGVTKVKELTSKILDDISSLFKDPLKMITDSKILETITSIIKWPVTRAKEVIERVRDYISSVFKDPIERLKKSGILTEIVSLITWPIEKIREITMGAGKWLSAQIERIPGIGKLLKWFGGAEKEEIAIEKKAIKVKTTGEVEDEIREEISKVSIKVFRDRLAKIAKKTMAGEDLHRDDLYFLNAMKKKYGIELDKGGITESVTGRIIEKSDLAKRKAADLLLEGEHAAGEFGKVTNKVMEKMTKETKQTNAAIMYNTNIMSTMATNLASTSSIGAGGGSGFTEFSSGDESVLNVIKCNIP